MLGIDEAVLECRRRTENLLQAPRILGAGQLHHDATVALLLDQRLGHAELVDPVAQRRDVLLECKLPDRLHLVGTQRGGDDELRATVRRGNVEVAELVADQLCSRIPGSGVAKHRVDLQAAGAHGRVAHLFFTQDLPDIVVVAIDGLGHRRIHVDVNQHVNSAPQVETEVHGLDAELVQPARDVCRKIQRQRVVARQHALERILGEKLMGRSFEANPDAVFDELGALEGHLRCLQRGSDLFDGRLTDLERRTGAADLHDRVLAEHVRQGVECAEQNDGENEQVLPQGIAVHSSVFPANRAGGPP